MNVMLRSADWYHLLPSEVKEILTRLVSAGHTTFVVGGAVRDLLLNRRPKDFDLVSSAKPAEVTALFEKTLEIGKQFGISMVVIGEASIEIATFRKESTYSDGRHPDRIDYATPQEDAARRDFTINGLFWSANDQQVIDYVGGLSDIDQKIIRCIGDSNRRFAEDALRMPRALRLYSALEPVGFVLDTQVMNGIAANRARIQNVSRERITEELNLLLQSDRPSLGVALSLRTGLWQEMFPGTELNDELIYKLDYFKPNWLALVLCATKGREEMLTSLVLRRALQKKIHFAIKLLDQITSLASGSLAAQKHVMVTPDFDSVVAAAAHFFAENRPIAQAARRLRENKEAFLRDEKLNPPPLVTGSDFKAAGLSEGAPLGKALQEIRTAQLNEIIHTKAEALNLVKKTTASG